MAPVGGDREHGAPERVPRRDDGAVFAATPVRSGGRSGALAGILAVGLGALVVAATMEPGGPESPAVVGPSRAPAAAAVETPSPRPLRTSRPGTGGVRPGPMGGRVELLTLDLRPAGSHLFVHGEVYSLRVESVQLRLVDQAGHVAQTERLRIPGGSTAFRLGAVPRFDVHFPVADEMLADGLFIEAHAIDERGKHLGLVRVPVTSPRGPM